MNKYPTVLVLLIVATKMQNFIFLSGIRDHKRVWSGSVLACRPCHADFHSLLHCVITIQHWQQQSTACMSCCLCMCWASFSVLSLHLYSVTRKWTSLLWVKKGATLLLPIVLPTFCHCEAAF